MISIKNRTCEYHMFSMGVYQDVYEFPDKASFMLHLCKPIWSIYYCMDADQCNTICQKNICYIHKFIIIHKLFITPKA